MVASGSTGRMFEAGAAASDGGSLGALAIGAGTGGVVGGAAGGVVGGAGLAAQPNQEPSVKSNSARRCNL
jgi:hypothetical protein